MQSYIVMRGEVDVTSCYTFADTVDGLLEIGYLLTITDGVTGTYDKDVIVIDGISGAVIHHGDSLDFNISTKVDVHSISVIVRMGGNEIEAYNAETSTSGSVNIDSVTGDVEVTVTYKMSEDGFNIIPIIITVAALIIIVIATTVVIKRFKSKKQQQQ